MLKCLRTIENIGSHGDKLNVHLLLAQVASCPVSLLISGGRAPYFFRRQPMKGDWFSCLWTGWLAHYRIVDVITLKVSLCSELERTSPPAPKSLTIRFAFRLTYARKIGIIRKLSGRTWTKTDIRTLWHQDLADWREAWKSRSWFGSNIRVRFIASPRRTASACVL